MIRSGFCVGAVVAGLVLPGVGFAEPATTAWVEDVSVQQLHRTQTIVSFEHYLSDIKARGEGIDVLRLSLESGVASSMSLAPMVSFRQRGEEPLRLQEVGLQTRWRALDSRAWPLLMVYGGYSNDLSDERDHLLTAGLAASYDYGPLYLNADLRPQLQFGGDHGRALEAWSGVAAGYGWGTSLQARAGLEAFAIMPLIGERLSDPTFGEAAESNSYYYGPSFALAVEPFWTTASVVTGYWLAPAASQFLLSWVVGVGY